MRTSDQIARGIVAAGGAVALFVAIGVVRSALHAPRVMDDPPFSTWLTFYLLLPALISGLLAFVPSLQTRWKSAALCLGGSILCIAGSMMMFSPTVQRGGWLSYNDMAQDMAMAFSYDGMTMAFVPFVTLFLGFLTVRQFSRPRFVLVIGPLAFLFGIALIFAVAVLMGSKMG